jgi:hypothetical protein
VTGNGLVLTDEQFVEFSPDSISLPDDSGGQQLETDNGTIQVAFDRPTVRGFERREGAVATAKSHIRRQFSRIGIDTEPEFHVDTPQEAGHVPPE